MKEEKEQSKENIDCYETGLLLTEYIHNQLTQSEKEQVEKSLETCIHCKKELRLFTNLNKKTDTIIPSLSDENKSSLMAHILITENTEPLFIKALTIVFTFLIISSFFIHNPFSYLITINYNYLENRADNLFRSHDYELEIPK